MIKKMRKGITPVIAIVLLLMMTVAIAGVAYVWLTKVQEDIQKGTEGVIKEKTEAMKASVSIDSIWKTGTAPDYYIALTVRNAGSHVYTRTEVEGFKVYLDNADADGSWISGEICESGSLVLSDTCDWDTSGTPGTIFPGSGTSFTMKVVDNFGNFATRSCTVNVAGTGCE